jgi:hypothetical protein
MFGLFDHPLLLLVFTFGASWLAHTYTFGRSDVDGNIFDDFKLVQTATLTLLAGYVTEGEPVGAFDSPDCLGHLILPSR